MRLPILLVLCLSLVSVSTANARLFWQTYGSTISSGEGGECTWNSNQDYFIPRHTSSCRYGLFSPCKKSRTNSPACVTCHPLYPGYCGIYGSCHYAWRNHVYQAYCGCCTPVQSGRGPWRIDRGCQKNCCEASSYCQSEMPRMASEARGYLPNIEPPEFAVLGSISVEGDGLLANLDLTPAEESDEDRVFLGPSTIIPSQILQKMGLPQP